MMIDPQHIGLVAFGIAFAAGLVSFLSPCVLPLVPAYIGYLSGATFSGGEITSAARRTTVAHATAFVGGFLTLFVLVGGVFGLVAWVIGLLTAGGSAAAGAGAAHGALSATNVLVDQLELILLRVGIVMLAVLAARVADSPLDGEWRIRLGPFELYWPDRLGPVRQRYVRWLLIGLLTALAYLWLTGRPYAPQQYLDAAMLLLLPLTGARPSAPAALALGLVVAGLNTWSIRLGIWIGQPIDWATAAIEAVLIVLVVYFLGRTMLFYQEKRFELSGWLRGRGYLTSGIMGAVFAAGWTPCTGPNLAIILVLAGSAGSAGIGTLLLITYALGLGLPFILVGFAFGSAAAGMRRLMPYMGVIKAINLFLLLFTAALLASGRLQNLAHIGGSFGIEL